MRNHATSINRTALAAVAAALLALPAVLPGQAVNRCIGPDGTTIYTDRGCEDIGALTRRPPEAGVVPDEHGGLRTPVPPGCAATPRELQSRLRLAAAARDINALSALYHWPGATSRSAQAVLASLQRVAELPMNTVELELPSIEAGSLEATGAIPHGVRIDHGGGAPGAPVPEPSRFALVHHAGCWWIRF